MVLLLHIDACTWPLNSCCLVLLGTQPARNVALLRYICSSPEGAQFWAEAVEAVSGGIPATSPALPLDEEDLLRLSVSPLLPLHDSDGTGEGQEESYTQQQLGDAGSTQRGKAGPAGAPSMSAFEIMEGDDQFWESLR